VIVLRKMIRYIRNPIRLLYRFVVCLDNTIYIRKLPDVLCIKSLYYLALGKKLDLLNPLTFSQKLQWLKIYYRNPLYTMIADKYRLREYVKSKGLEKHLVPFIGTWDNFDDIDFDKLPSKFVLKCNHDCGSTIICKEKESFDIDYARAKLMKCMNTNYYFSSPYREWQYRDIIPKILGEHFIAGSDGNAPADYKVHCFNSVPKYIQLISGRFTRNISESWYDENWNYQDLTYAFPCSSQGVDRPKELEELLSLSSKLSQGIPYVRVDFYIAKGNVYLGELTFTPWAGFIPFKPQEWDKRLGDLIELPKKYTV